MISANSTTQEIFDHVVTSLFAQNERCSKNSHGGCRYRLKQDNRILRCAVGHCIPDYYYHEWMEEKLVSEICQDDRCPTDLRKMLKGNLPLFKELQYIHDNFLPSAWKRKFEDLANRFDLKCPT